jgi:pimeloyl-ACP methyl ester carboxylesterase
VKAIDSLSAPRAVLWGTSFGSLVALATAARHPERVSGLLLSHPPILCGAGGSTLRCSTGPSAAATRTSSPHLLFSTAFLE